MTKGDDQVWNAQRASVQAEPERCIHDEPELKCLLCLRVTQPSPAALATPVKATAEDAVSDSEIMEAAEYWGLEHVRDTAIGYARQILALRDKAK